MLVNKILKNYKKSNHVSKYSVVQTQKSWYSPNSVTCSANRDYIKLSALMKGKGGTDKTKEQKKQITPRLFI